MSDRVYQMQVPFSTYQTDVWYNERGNGTGPLWDNGQEYDDPLNQENHWVNYYVCTELTANPANLSILNLPSPVHN